MSAEPKPLTEAEREGLIEAIQDGTEDAYVAQMLAAARREALLEVQSRLQPPPPWPATGSEAPDRGYDAGWCDALAVVEELLAEPERDEEGGND